MHKAVLGKVPKLQVSSELHKAIETLKKEKAELEALVSKQREEKEQLRSRLDFVESIVGPTESQRKDFHQQLLASRAAAIHASHITSTVPTRFLGRLNLEKLASYGISEHDCALLQRGCVPGDEGVPQDVSLLGDPNFRPYDPLTLEPAWEARGGFLQLTLADVRERWGEAVAQDVVRCAIELDRHDASRRLGLELPWHFVEDRELQPAEIIMLLAQANSRGASPESRELWGERGTEWSMLESVLWPSGEGDVAGSLEAGERATEDNLSEDWGQGTGGSTGADFEDEADNQELFEFLDDDVATSLRLLLAGYGPTSQTVGSRPTCGPSQEEPLIVPVRDWPDSHSGHSDAYRNI